MRYLTQLWSKYYPFVASLPCTLAFSLLFVQDTSDVDDALQIVGCQGATKGFLIQKGLKGGGTKN